MTAKTNPMTPAELAQWNTEHPVGTRVRVEFPSVRGMFAGTIAGPSDGVTVLVRLRAGNHVPARIDRIRKVNDEHSTTEKPYNWTPPHEDGAHL